ncbi:hypothetical protein HW932_02300 [Allochromatium humboldtianum]|uniref:Uncharacterized protein n=1 Tax=Allochromatium humboldtianum TaxID=504901 RepID=A0A850R9Y4_9GAMM|nr:hypothetical protein [Allochromatium humboldtianum]NVZ08092.1 hypothetical protein [Allochromatium humboldtianum]
MDTNQIFVLLPACTFPNKDTNGAREVDLQENLLYLGAKLPEAQFVVCDNGQRAPDVPAGVTLVHDRGAFSDNPSIGECRNLLSGLHCLDDEALAIKLHARCKLLNFRAFDAFLQENHAFFLASPNIWSHGPHGYDELPYLDTRVFAARVGILRRLLADTLALLESEGGRMERAMLAVVLRRPEDCALVHTSGSFFPILSGAAGHGRNYTSPTALVRSYIKALIYRFGL